MGKFSVRFTSKDIDIIDSRKFHTQITSAISWVEDGAIMVIDHIARSSENIADLFLSEYPEDLPVRERITETKEKRKTLLYRFRFLLHRLEWFRGDYEKFEQWRFAGLELILDILESTIRQAFGDIAYRAFSSFYARLKRFWKTGCYDLDSPEAIGKEACLLREEIQSVFEILHRECEKRERAMAIENARKERANEDVIEVKEALANHIDALGAKVDENHEELVAKVDESQETIVAKVEEASSNLASKMAGIDAKIDVVSKQITEIRSGKSKQGRRAVGEKVADVCRMLWDTAPEISEIRNSANTKISFKKVFEYHHHRLERIGINTAEAFKATVQNAQRRAARKMASSRPAPGTNPPPA